MNSFGWLRYSGFARHKDPKLDAAGALADLLVFSLNLTGLDILQKNAHTSLAKMHVICAGGLTGCFSKIYGMPTKSKTGML